VTGERIGPAQVAVLLDPFARAVKVQMPAQLGEWRPSAGPGLWRFELSVIGIDTAARARDLVDASNEALDRYLAEAEPAQCLTGAFRDGFSHGANWQRRQSEEVHHG
jgi:hypothetical protein